VITAMLYAIATLFWLVVGWYALIGVVFGALWLVAMVGTAGGTKKR